MDKSIIVCGDIHGYWRYLNTLINKKKPKLILQCGDWGWWPKIQSKPFVKNGVRYLGFNPFGVKAGKTKIIFADGNHEDHCSLDCWDCKTLPELMPNVFYAKRGTTYTLPDGRIVLFMGGAASIDKAARTPGVDWFPQEVLTLSELYKLEECKLDRIDIVISHTCPQEFNASLKLKQPYGGWEHKFRDTSQEVLSELLHWYKPSLWYFGHFHIHMEGLFKETGTKWVCLNETSNTNWWKYLDN